MKIGAAVSPYQHFGYCICDLPPEPGSYHLKYYEVDLAYAKAAGIDVIRTGIDWGTIEPKPGQYSREEVARYRDYLAYAKSLGMETWVTLHHFANPPWLWRLGGWHRKGIHMLFTRFAEVVLSELGDLIDVVLIFNEPNVYVYEAYIRGTLPPYCTACLNKAGVASSEIRDAILEVRDLAKSYGKPASTPVHYSVYTGAGILDRLVAKLLNRDFLSWLEVSRELDFYAINFYVVGEIRRLRAVYRFDPSPIRSLPSPLAITEIGVAGSDEEKIEYACMVSKALEGRELLGVIWWSLVHGFEWGLGYGVDFSLIFVDVWHGFKRIPRKSLWSIPRILRGWSRCAGPSRAVTKVFAEWRTRFGDYQ